MEKIDLTTGRYKELQERFWDEVKKYAKYSQNATGFDEAAAKSQLLTGKAAHLMSGSWDIQSFMENEEKCSYRSIQTSVIYKRKQ